MPAEMIAIDTTPYIAHALALSTDCHQALNAVFNADRARYYAAAMRSPHRNSPELKKGRAEQQVLAMRALGLLAGDASEASLRRVLRAANRRIYDAVALAAKSGGKCETGALLAAESAAAKSDTHFWCALMLLAADMQFFSVQASDDKLRAMLGDYVRAQSPRAKAPAPSRESLLWAKRTFAGDMSDIGALFASTDESTGADMDRAFMAAEMENIDLSEYCADVLLSRSDIAACRDIASENCAERVVLLALVKALKRDREFCLRLYREDKTIDLESAKAELSHAKSEIAALEKRCAALESENASAEQRCEKLTIQLSERESEIGEIAELRRALYAAQSPGDEQPPEENKRAVPEGVIVLGGSPVWSAAMRKALPGLKIISADQSFTDADIRAASEVWFQALFINHSNFYRAVSIARAYKIPVRYFSSTGAQRSVGELQTSEK